METAILFLIFNRPEKTAIVFEKIKEKKPKKLYIAADGPRQNRPGETEKCEAAKKIVLDGIDWDCELKTLFREENLGCGDAVSQSINWFFEQEEQGIILEDDCLANDSFFPFCEELLAKYASENKVMMITGCSFQDKPLDNYSYYFSRYIHVWGWATWRRAWQLYEYKPADVGPSVVSKVIDQTFKKKRERELWTRSILQGMSGAVNTWDYQWMYAIWKNNGLSIVPWKNLVSNIGYGEDATHTVGFNPNTIELTTYQLNQVKHPPKVKVNKKADKLIRYKLIITKTTFIAGLKGFARRIIDYKKKHV